MIKILIELLQTTMKNNLILYFLADPVRINIFSLSGDGIIYSWPPDFAEDSSIQRVSDYRMQLLQQRFVPC